MTQVSTNKPERVRSREPRDEREPGMGAVVPWDQGRLFAQFFSSQGEGGSGFSPGRAQPASLGDTALLEMFSEHLAPRLNAAIQWPLQAALYLPRLNWRLRKNAPPSGSLVRARAARTGWPGRWGSRSVWAWFAWGRHDGAVADITHR
jgi:hypothetical protein